MENKSSKSKATASTSASAPAPVVSGGNKIVEKKLNNQVVELSSQPVKKGGAKKVESVQSAQSAQTAQPAQTAQTAQTAQPVQSATAQSAPVQQKGKGKGKKVENVVSTASTATSATSATTTTPSKKVSAKKNVVSTELEAEPEAQSKLRYFKLFYNNEICGRYCGKKPKQAANKAFSSIVKDMKKDGVSVTPESQLEVPFTIKECTRNSKHKEYKYIGKRHLLKEPVKVSIENGDGSVKEIVYKFHNQLQKAPKE
jgi:hypothetical protein